MIMAYAPSAMAAMYPIIEAEFDSAERSGIVGGSYGYHRSRNQLLSAGLDDDYSIQHKLDRGGDDDAASAIDTSLSDKDMITATRNLLNACLEKDPRVVGKMREFFGTLNGTKVTGYNPTSGEERYVSADSSHLWHVHISVYRNFSNDPAVCRGIAECMAGIGIGAGGGSGDVEVPTWDGKSFPGRAAFVLNKRNDAVTLLGKRLVAHGCGKYEVGPGPVFTEVDMAGVKAFQKAQGWTGTDADGYPGPETWRLLMAAPAKPPVKPKPEPKPAVDLSKLVEAAKADPKRKQGGTTAGAGESVEIVEHSLRLEKLLKKDYASDGSFGSLTVDAYAAWQRKLGYSGKDADGIPGKASLQKLGAKYKFTVKD